MPPLTELAGESDHLW